MIQLYRFHMKNGTQKEATGNTDIEAANKINLKIKDYESYEILPGKSLTAEASGTPVPESTNTPVNPTPEPIKAEANMPGEKKSRKPRADKGQPRVPDKPKRNRGEYFIYPVEGTLSKGLTREEAEKVLSDNPLAGQRIILGHQLEFSRKVSFTLKPAK